MNELINFGAKVQANELVYQPIFAKVKVHLNASDFESNRPVVLTVGTFDGVHIGHRAVIDLLTQRARELKGESVLLTFHPHPRTVLHPEQHQLKLLNTIEEQKMLLRDAGLDHLVIHPFTEEFSRKTPLEYVRDLFAEGIQPQKVIIGYDHRFGRNREGSFDSLINLGKVFGFSVEELPVQTIEDTKVSSTKVREALHAGHVAQARRWLNRPYPLSGQVQRGEQLGRKLLSAQWSGPTRRTIGTKIGLSDGQSPHQKPIEIGSCRWRLCGICPVGRRTNLESRHGQHRNTAHD